MKRLGLIIVVLLIGLGQMLADSSQNCYQHYCMVIKQNEDGTLYGRCDSCNNEIKDLSKWQQTIDMGITVNDPYLNVQADIYDIGTVSTNITSKDPMLQMWLINDETKKIAGYQDCTADPQYSLQVNMPRVEKTTSVTLIVQLKVTKTDDDGKSQEYKRMAVKHFTYKPFHAIKSMTVQEVGNLDDNGIKNPYNVVKWCIDNVDDEDVMNSDLFTVVRSYYSDFSEYTSLGSVSISDTIRKETLADGTVRGWYEFEDQADEVQYNTSMSFTGTTYAWGCDSLLKSASLNSMDTTVMRGFFTLPNRQMYYRVSRALVENLWPSHTGEFVIEDSVSLSSMLPAVTGISVVKEDNFDKTKNVTIKLKLDNPYPWTYNNLASVEGVKAATKALGMDGRRYRWDEKASIKIVRYSPKEEYDSKGNDVAAGTITVDGSTVTWNNEEGCYEAEAGDCQSMPYTHYYYKAIVDGTNSVYPTTTLNDTIATTEFEANECYTETCALVSGLTASTDILGKVNVHWNLGSGSLDVLTLQRREFSKDNTNAWENLKISQKDTREYEDKNVTLGKVYEYKVTAQIAYHGHNYCSSDSVVGYPSFYGGISGHVSMPNGVAIANARVIVSRKSNIYIEDVVDKNGKIILKGVQEGVITQAKTAQVDSLIYNDPTAIVAFADTVYTDENGAFSFDSLLFALDDNATNTEYKISVVYGSCEFKYNDTADIKVSLSAKNPEVTDMKIKCYSYQTVEGTVYYEKSTVPVRDVSFVMTTLDGQEYIMKDEHGNNVVTGSDGSFKVLVPKIKLKSFRMMKEGHVFGNNGIVNVDDDQPQTLWDSTKVRLIGRVCGGNIEARKKLGFGLSKNNLGDDLTIVMQLEGDNVSSLYFDNLHADNTQIDSTYVHEYGSKASTQVSVQRKRIVIKPDVNTGEFMLDIFPTKFKVTQLSAKGYSTLYASGEGFDVLDFSDSTKVYEIVNPENAEEKLEYGATYVKAYHKAATITYDQYVYGVKTGYLGDEKITETDVNGVESTAVVASYDKTTGKASYLFDYPIFSMSNNYTLQVRAHEDFYYNNDEGLGLKDEVHLDGGKLHVQNGLLDNGPESEYTLDSLGTAKFSFTAGNTTFNQTEEDALRYMSISVEVNGYFYEANPLAGFVTGYRDKNTDVQALSQPVLLDILRDPYGASSYSWVNSGTSYTWNSNLSIDISGSLDTTIKWGYSANTFVGAFAGVGAGAVSGTNISSSSQYSFTFKVPVISYSLTRNGEYTMTTSKKIQTSSEPADVGAMADVYIGTVTTSMVQTAETFSVIDSTSYAMIQGAVKRGTVRIVKSGKDANGNTYYLAIANKIHVTPNKEQREFAYSQKYIYGTLLPDLINKRSSLLLYAEDKQTIQKKADEGKTVLYWSKVPADDENFGLPTYYEPCYGVEGTTNVDEVNEINKTISQWMYYLAKNEKTKLDNMNATGNNVKHYSIAGSSIESSEEMTSNYVYHWSVGVLGADTKKLVSGDGLVGAWGFGASTPSLKNLNTNAKASDQQKNVKNALNKAFKTANFYKNNDSNSAFTSQVEAPGTKWDFDFVPNISVNVTHTTPKTIVSNASHGYSIGTTDNSYFDIDVVKVRADSAEANYMSTTSRDNTIESNPAVSADQQVDEGYVAYTDYLFYLRGGAVRNPYFDCDSTIAYAIDGKSLALGTSPLKIDNPQIYVENPVISNLPEDESAVFTVHLTNASELGTNVTNLKYSHFQLYVEDSTNPNGAKFTMDGEPLTEGREFLIAPGESITKTIEVARGKGYDFKNMQLVFCDPMMILNSTADVTVNYLPMATNVNITSPTDKWVMNTFSAKDDAGKYYIPVNIEGFNVNSDGFHHIELQYKKQTEGDSQWVTCCSYFNNDSLYALATGTKEKIPASGKISNVKFYGEADPVEMKYDLRAVAFRQLGTGFTSRASSVMSGTKDTRCPEVFGLPKPTNGVLTFSDVISVPFNEPIAYNYLQQLSNFQVMGFLNDTKNSYNTMLRYSHGKDFNPDPLKYSDFFEVYGSDLINNSHSPSSKISRNLTGSDFCIDMMARLIQTNQFAYLAMINDKSLFETGKGSYMAYSYYAGYFRMELNGAIFESEKVPDEIDLTKELNHIGLSVSDLSGVPEVKFFVGGTELKTEHIYVTETDENNSPVSRDYVGRAVPISTEIKGDVRIGVFMDGDIADVKLWSKALDFGEFQDKEGERLSKNEANLMAYWPMDEGKDTVLYDKINGCDLYFSTQQWVGAKSQCSLSLDGKEVPMTEKGAGKFTSGSGCDYTLSFWMKAAEIKSDKDFVPVISIGAKNDENYFGVGFKDYALKLVSGADTCRITEKEDVVDGKWHNFVVVSNHSQNAVSFFIDGDMVKSLANDSLKDINSTCGSFGDVNFVGNIDNLTFWNMAYPSNCIEQIYKYAPSGKEMGLKVYLPFEVDSMTVNNTEDIVFSSENMAYNYTDDESGTLVLDKTQMLDISSNASVGDKDNYCPVSSAVGMQTLPFSWTSTDNELQINIQKPDWQINHQNLHITVRNVEDLQGNVQQNPQTMMVYVNRNRLQWIDVPTETVSVPYGEDYDISLNWENKSGQELSYTLEENYSWLSLDKVTGDAAALSKGTVVATIAGGLAPGDYEATIYLTDENKLSSAATIKVTVAAEEPEWAVTSDSTYCYTMNLRGQVMLSKSANASISNTSKVGDIMGLTQGSKDSYDTDVRDIVAAFYNGVCVGKANVSVDENGIPYVYMTIYGNKDMLPQKIGGGISYKEVTFRLWRFSTNKTTYLTPSYFVKTVVGNDTIDEQKTRVNFDKNAAIGCPPNSPVTFTLSNEIVQRIGLTQGWNWISFNIRPMNQTGVNMLFAEENIFTSGDRIVYTDNTGKRIVSTWIEDKNGNTYWDHGIDGINNLDRHVYQMYVQNPATAAIHGYEMTDDERYVKLVPAADGNWNELAYLLDVDQRIEVAMSDFSSDKAKEGTVIKGINSFAVMNGNGKWEGSLKYMKPGQGYFTKVFAVDGKTDTITVKYTNTSVSGNAKASSFDDEDLDLSLTRGAAHANSMPVIATSTDEFQQGDKIVACSNGELVGEAQETECENGSKRFFITLNAEEGASVRFAHIRNDEVIAKSAESLSFDSDNVSGTLDVPYVINFSESTEEGDVYDITGIKYADKKQIEGRKGVFIIGNQKVAK